MIMKFKISNDGWCFIDKINYLKLVKTISYQEFEEKIKNIEDYINVSEKDDEVFVYSAKGDKDFNIYIGSSMIGYLLNDDGKTIERL